MATIGQAVMALREEHGVSVSKLQRDADLSYQTVRDVERDWGNPTVQTLSDIAAVFGMTLNELYEYAAKLQ